MLRDVLDLLDSAGIAYMIVGSMASNLWGMPRATQDADLVVELDVPKLDRFVSAATPRYYVPEGLARAAVDRGGMFNLIHGESAFKVDLVVLRRDPSSRAEFSRRREATWLGRGAWFAAPSDVIISKLRWHREGGGERQLRDCAGILRTQGARLDREELRDRARDAGVLTLLEPLLAEASPD